MANTQLALTAVKLVLNAASDHYNKSDTRLSREDYWRNRLKLTGVQSFDSYVQGLVDKHIDCGFTFADTIALEVKEALGIRS